MRALLPPAVRHRCCQLPACCLHPPRRLPRGSCGTGAGVARVGSGGGSCWLRRRRAGWDAPAQDAHSPRGEVLLVDTRAAACRGHRLQGTRSCQVCSGRPRLQARGSRSTGRAAACAPHPQLLTSLSTFCTSWGAPWPPRPCSSEEAAVTSAAQSRPAPGACAPAAGILAGHTRVQRGLRGSAPAGGPQGAGRPGHGRGASPIEPEDDPQERGTRMSDEGRCGWPNEMAQEAGESPAAAQRAAAWGRCIAEQLQPPLYPSACSHDEAAHSDQQRRW